MLAPSGDMADDDQPKLEGIADDIGDFLSKALPIVETVLPIVAPQTAPIVAAERALRTGATLAFNEAKKATKAATSIGNAVAASQGVTPPSSTTDTASSPIFTTATFASPSTTTRKPAPAPAPPEPSATNSGSFWIIGGAIALLLIYR